MELEEFCIKIAALGMTHSKLGISVLWYLDDQTPGHRATAGEISKILRDTGIAEPHSTNLGRAMLRTRLIQKSGSRHLKLKPASRAVVCEWFESILQPEPQPIDQDAGFLPRQVWTDTRGYIERIATQINGSYQFGLYDGAAVLSRRLIETLLIEAYENCGSSDAIKDADDNYTTLGSIIDHATNGGLPLGRELKRDLPKIKTLGDRSAHNRRFIAKQSDLDKIESGLRLVVEELLVIAELR